VSKPSSGLLKMLNRKSKKTKGESINDDRKCKQKIQKRHLHSGTMQLSLSISISAFANIGFMDQIKD